MTRFSQAIQTSFTRKVDQFRTLLLLAAFYRGVTDSEQIAQLTAELTWLRRLTRALLDETRGPDLAHDTWLVASERAPTDGRPLRPWLVRVARNIARMGGRAERRRARREESAADLVDAVPTPEALVARAEAQRSVVEAVLALGEPHRSTVLLHYFEELSSAEIARRLKLPDGTVRRRLKEALDHLRVHFGAADPERKRALVPLLLPLASSKSVPISVGVLAMKKLVVVLAVVLALVGATVWWKHSRDTQSATNDSVVAGGTGNATTRRSAAGATEPLAWLSMRGAPQRVIAGRVTFQSTPVAGAIVTVLDPLTLAGAQPKRELRTDASGHFDFGKSPPFGNYRVAASAPGRIAAIVSIDLADPAARPASDQLELRLGACAMTVSGTVFDAASNAIRGAHVLRDGVVGAEADDRGSYKLCAPRGHVDIIYAADGYGSVSLSVDVQGDVRQDVVLVPEAVIVGRVVSASDGTGTCTNRPRWR